mmetsp:Transcript_27930/g.50378  ORF Transcript_27930/g.50378 Transcript_27930/m.50378 type:complete len:80 (+) Transcript_27930:32-271(+)
MFGCGTLQGPCPSPAPPFPSQPLTTSAHPTGAAKGPGEAAPPSQSGLWNDDTHFGPTALGSVAFSPILCGPKPCTHAGK